MAIRCEHAFGESEPGPRDPARRPSQGGALPGAGMKAFPAKSGCSSSRWKAGVKVQEDLAHYHRLGNEREHDHRSGAPRTRQRSRRSSPRERERPAKTPW